MSKFIAERFAVYLTNLEPAFGVEMRKIRPCVIISPEQMHRNVYTVIIAPMTTTQARFPTRVPCQFAGKVGEVALDQMRSVDVKRLGKKLGKIDPATAKLIIDKIIELFK